MCACGRLCEIQVHGHGSMVAPLAWDDSVRECKRIENERSAVSMRS